MGQIRSAAGNVDDAIQAAPELNVEDVLSSYSSQLWTIESLLRDIHNGLADIHSQARTQS
jgi:hypothetical protein